MQVALSSSSWLRPGAKESLKQSSLGPWHEGCVRRNLSLNMEACATPNRSFKVDSPRKLHRQVAPASEAERFRRVGSDAEDGKSTRCRGRWTVVVTVVESDASVGVKGKGFKARERWMFSQWQEVFLKCLPPVNFRIRRSRYNRRKVCHGFPHLRP